MARKIREKKLTGVTTQVPREYEAKHAQFARTVAAEGFVLLENKDQILPLEKGSKVAVYGAGASKTVKGGTGSGDVNERESVTIFQGLKNAGFQVTTEDWNTDYLKRYEASRVAWRDVILGEVEENSDMRDAFFQIYSAHQYMLPAGGPVSKTDTDTAIYAIARIAGENADRNAEKNDYYLNDEEYAHLKDLNRLYKNVIVLINSGGVMDLSFMDEFENIKALMVVSQPGMEGGNAVGDVLCGDVTPSGKLTDTWAYQYEDYPSSATFSHNNGNLEKEAYVDGIYVGYRYFDSFDLPVRYGFGYGMSYTDFNMKLDQIDADPNGIVTVKVTVENTGDCAGKEVVELYAGLPNGRLEKEARRLVAFAKTDLLKAGETQTLTISFGAERLENFDEDKASWILEAGVYGIYLGASLGQSRLVASLKLENEKVLVRTCHVCECKENFEELTLSEERREGRYQKMLKEAEGKPSIDYSLDAVSTRVIDYTECDIQDEAAEVTNELTVDQLIELANGDQDRAQGSKIGSAGTSVPGSAGETSSCALEQGISNIVLADGPAGLRLHQYYYVNNGIRHMLPFEISLEGGFFFQDPGYEGEKYYQYCTAVPVGTLLAQSFNVSLLEEIGDMIGDELEEFEVQLWLAPGMNIHRNPLCGRNFEYFSEDPVVSGVCAAAITRGVQSHDGIGTTIKHFACNNQEDNRMASDSVISEKVLREIYMKGFEIAIAESKPLGLMTSYNLINSVHAANNYDLCTKVARKEFGFDGVIMTDWTTTNVDENCTAAGCMLAGNDLVMPGKQMDLDSIRDALEDGTLTEEQLRRCVANLVRVIFRTNCYE